MKNILIIYPHWPPSNLAGVHRARLIANFLPKLGWHPIVLTVNEEYYDEPLDKDITKTVSPQVEVHKVNASNPLTFFGKRIIGDIGLRGFSQLYQKAMVIIREQKPDFLWIPIPSFYIALLGRLLHQKTGILYGIDYIDPWVSKLADYDTLFSKAWWSQQLAKLLEPVAVKKASLISGVSRPYYQAVLERNFQNCSIAQVAMPYGFDPADHQIILKNLSLPWEKNKPVKAFVYAGAFLPQSHLFIDYLFQSIQQLQKSVSWDDSIKLYFLGTGHYGGKQLRDYAADYGISSTVHEINERFPYLHILNFLSRAQGVMVIGSTEKHYTASKTFQSLLSGKPVFTIFHAESSAVKVMNEAKAAAYTVKYHEGLNSEDLKLKIRQKFQAFINLDEDWHPELSVLDRYSALASAQTLCKGIDAAIQKEYSY